METFWGGGEKKGKVNKNEEEGGGLCIIEEEEEDPFALVSPFPPCPFSYFTHLEEGA